MRKLKIIPFIGLLLTMATAWAGEDRSSGEQASQVKPYIFASQSMQITAVVEAINHETRVVTLRGPQGNTVTFTVDEKARNLDQVDVGDIVHTEYVQSISIEVMANTGVEAGEGAFTVVERAAEGDTPGVIATDTRIVTATVEAIDLESNTFKLKGPDGIVEEYMARNPENLKRAAVGDLVVITNTEAWAISVEKTVSE